MEFAPPSGPPPPKLPAGWAARWNDQYSEWFYVNIHTKQSQWEKPTEPVYPATGSEETPPGPPPGYNPASAQPVSDSKTGSSRLSSNNPYGQVSSPDAATFPSTASTGPQANVSEDERMARELQAEEDARGAASANASRGASDSYYQQQQQPGAGFNQSLPPRPEGKSKGFLGKLFGKSGSSSHGQQQYGAPPQGYGAPPQGYGAPQPAPYGAGGAYPQQQPYPGYGYPPAPYGGGYGGYGGRPPRRQGGGMGAGGAAALGAGGGLLGGVLLADALDDDGSDGGDDGGGDDGGGDDGGD